MILDKKAYTYDDVLIVPKMFCGQSRTNINTLNRYGLNPIISANMDTITGFNMARLMEENYCLGMLNRSAHLNEIVETVKHLDSPCISFGLNWRTGITTLFDLGLLPKVAYICIDVAHGHSFEMIKSIENLKEYLRDNKKLYTKIIAGNICTVEGAIDLFSAGADIIKVGVGPGSVCTTRIKTGAGYPQLSAIHDIHAECPKIPLIADGGIKTPGDVVKAIGAGADFVMIGGMFAGTDWTTGWGGEGADISYRGMASSDAKIYRGEDDKFVEGEIRTLKAKPKGSSKKVIDDILDGLRSGISYAGFNSLQEFKGNATFIPISESTVLENHPHFKV